MISTLDKVFALVVSQLAGIPVFMPGMLKQIMNEAFIAFLNMFGCSIFIAVALMHLFPEAQEFYEQAGYTSYPYNGFYTIMGQLLMLLVENSLMDPDHHGHSHGDHSESHLHQHDDHHHGSQHSDMDLTNIVEYSSKQKKKNQNMNFIKKHKRQHKSQSDPCRKHNLVHQQLPKEEVSSLEKPIKIENDIVNEDKYSPLQRKTFSKEMLVLDAQIPGQINNIATASKRTGLAAATLAIGLVVHDIIEGVSIGLSPTPDKLWLILAGVCVHKAITMFSLGLSFLKANWLDSVSYSIMLLTTLAGPIGTMFGFLVKADSPMIVQAVTASLTTGTFLYISMTEIINIEFSKRDHYSLKIAGFLVGIVLFSVFMQFDEHGHEHHEYGHETNDNH